MALNQMGGAFDPAKDVELTGTVSFTGAVNFATAPTGGASGTSTFVTTTGTQTLTSKTLTAPTVTAPVISGAATVASGAVLTTPTVILTSSSVIATGATGTDSAALSAITPVLVVANSTGVSGAGVGIPTGAGVAGAHYTFFNQMTGLLKIYAVGGTINGTTGTTAFSLTATGNKFAEAICTAAGTWFIAGNT